MKNSKKLALGIVSATAGLAASGVFAADGNTWTGFNVYGGVGYTNLDSKESSHAGSSDASNTANFSGTHSKSKITGKLGLGYDFKLAEKMVVGVFADVNLGSLKTKSDQAWDNGTYTLTTSTKVKDAYSLGAKLGYLLSDNDLLYVSGGASRAKIKTNFSSRSDYGNANTYGPWDLSSNKSKTGAFVGLGLEHKINQNISVVGDYRVTDYGSVKTENFNGYASPVQSHKVDVKTENLSLNLKYSF